MENNQRRKGDLVWCDGCQKYITYYLETRVIKLDNWDLLCIHCDTWIGGMKDFYGWEITL
jgi:hypothetical protein